MRSVRVLIPLILFALPLVASGQESLCLAPERVEALRKEILAPAQPQTQNLALQTEILALQKEIVALVQRSRFPGKDGDRAKDAFNTQQRVAAARICSLLNSGAWPGKSVVGEEGATAFLYVIGRTMSVRQQLQLYPLVAAAFEKGEIAGSETLASYVDRLRVALGRKQLYGTQVTIRDGFLVQAPIELATEVNKRRETMKLVPLRQYERALEMANRLPLIRDVTEPVGTFSGRRLSAGPIAAANVEDSLGLEGDGPVIKLETAFVSLDVNVPDAADGASLGLEKKDFKLYDSGKPVDIETFAKAETPFDIVLLLDLSGSTSDKIGLIRKTTRRFVEMKRPGDRVAVITFTHDQTVISELESDQATLLKRIKDIEGGGASAVWGSLNFAMEMLDEKSEKGRRRAIVIMSDGADNQLGFYARAADRTSYADLIELIQNSNTTIFPVFLDTFDGNDSLRENSFRTLEYIAEQSGGTLYTAKKLDDVADIYDRVLKGVGTVYTLGFSPESESAGREWRTLKVEVPSRPGLRLRHRPGYFTR